MLAWRTPRTARFVFFNAQGDVMAARVVRDPAGGSKSLPDGAVHKGRGTRQLHDVSGKVQRVRLRIAAQKRDVRVAALEMHS